MTSTLELLRDGQRGQIWQKYCGFVDLSVAEFMLIQRRLLLEQIDLLGKSALGRQLLREPTPASVEEFRDTVPLTTYKDYLPHLLQQSEEVLPSKAYWWVHTSGRSGEYPFKWVPYSERMVQRIGECIFAVLIFASCSRRGEFVFEEKDSMLFALAPFPYLSGAAALAIGREFNFTFVPPIERAVQMPFQERISEGFRLALKEGLDTFQGIASVLARVSDQFVEGHSTIRPSLYLLHPKVAFRLVRGLARARLDRRKHFLPKDFWDVKCIVTAGTDTALFKEKISNCWGRRPGESYACTEGGVLATQLWNGKGLTFFPDVAFLEFIPEDERAKSAADPGYKPRTLLLDEVEAGKRYEIVLTNLLGGVMVRYRVGDLIEIVALRDEELGVNLPQVVFYSRVDDVIDIGGIARLTERPIWQAIANAGFQYVDWVATKEYENGQVLLHLYIEPKGEVQVEQIQERIMRNLQRLDPDYADLEKLWNMNGFRVTLLPSGSFVRYSEARQAEGADLAQLKPPHMKPKEEVLSRLLAIGSQTRAG